MLGDKGRELQSGFVEGARHVQPLEHRLIRCSAVGDLAHRGNDEGQDFASSERHAHDVTDAKRESAGIVG